MGQFFRILLYSPRLTISACLLMIGGVSGALKHRDAEAKKPNPWGTSEYASDTAHEVGGWGKDTAPATRLAPAGPRETNEKVWNNEDGVIFEEEDVKALDPSEYE